MGRVHDSNPPHLAEFVPTSGATLRSGQSARESGAEMLLNFIPTESHRAARAYADAAIKGAKIGFVNGMPTLIVSDPEYQKAARENGVPIIGDDVKSQLGGTAIHRALASLFSTRGVHIGNLSDQLRRQHRLRELNGAGEASTRRSRRR